MKRGLPVRRSRAAGWSRLIGGLVLPVLALGALGARIGMVPQGALIPVLGLGIVLGLLALGLGAYALVDIWNCGADGAGSAIAGIAYASPAFVLVAGIAFAAIFYPPITEVSTDVLDPPAMPGGAAARADQPAAERVAMQADAYPDLGPRRYALPMAQVYVAARTLVEDRGWDLVSETAPPSMPVAEPAAQSRGDAAAEASRAATNEVDPPSAEVGTLQAVAFTPLFGFADDVVLRLVTEDGGTRVDMRSASRLGAHDLGQNARRIRAFFADLDFALQPDPGMVAPSAPIAVPVEPVGR